MKKRTIRNKAKGRGNTKAKAKGRGMTKANAKGRGKTRRGGSTTEQIGAAAQMRVYLNPSTTTHQLLNEIVHHESRNRFHDLEYNYNPEAQTYISDAYKMIRRTDGISEDIKKQMQIAKKKAKRSSGIVVPIIARQSPSEFPELVAPPRPPPRVDAVVTVAPESVLRPQPQVQPVQNVDVARTNLLRSSLGFLPLGLP